MFITEDTENEHCNESIHYLQKTVSFAHTDRNHLPLLRCVQVWSANMRKELKRSHSRVKISKIQQFLLCLVLCHQNLWKTLNHTIHHRQMLNRQKMEVCCSGKENIQAHHMNTLFFFALPHFIRMIIICSSLFPCLWGLIFKISWMWHSVTQIHLVSLFLHCL